MTETASSSSEFGVERKRKGDNQILKTLMPVLKSLDGGELPGWYCSGAVWGQGFSLNFQTPWLRAGCGLLIYSLVT